jgi:hypothetical protein
MGGFAPTTGTNSRWGLVSVEPRLFGQASDPSFNRTRHRRVTASHRCGLFPPASGRLTLYWANPEMLRSVSTFSLAVLLAGCVSQASPLVHDGDIVFQTSRSTQSAAIQKATHSQYSHMGLVLYRNGQPYVVEAIGPVKGGRSGACAVHTRSSFISQP